MGHRGARSYTPEPGGGCACPPVTAIVSANYWPTTSLWPMVKESTKVAYVVCDQATKRFGDVVALNDLDIKTEERAPGDCRVEEALLIHGGGRC